MIPCLNSYNGSVCKHLNRDGARHCNKCGQQLKDALQLLNIGTRVNNYVIDSIIGWGGQGAVYKTRDLRYANNILALKEIVLYRSENIDSVSLEFRALHNLYHKSLPQYKDLFTSLGNMYLVMEYIPGENLEDVLTAQGSSLSEQTVLAYMVQICDVLEYLHTQSDPIIHRDIKPSNIRVRPDGIVKLVDFGIIKQGYGRTIDPNKSLTPEYAPIEQWVNTRPGGTDAKSDIYSLGATMYHLLTNEVPPSALRRTIGQDCLKSPEILNFRLSTNISNILMKAMNIEAKDRYKDIAAFRHALLNKGNNKTIHTSRSNTNSSPSSVPSQKPVIQVHPPSPPSPPPPVLPQYRKETILPIKKKSVPSQKPVIQVHPPSPPSPPPPVPQQYRKEITSSTKKNNSSPSKKK